MNMIFDFYIPGEYRGKEIEVPEFHSGTEKITLNIPSTTYYLSIGPYYDEESEIDDQLKASLSNIKIKYFNSIGNDIGDELIEDRNLLLESRLELIFKRVKS